MPHPQISVSVLIMGGGGVLGETEKAESTLTSVMVDFQRPATQRKNSENSD